MNTGGYLIVVTSKFKLFLIDEKGMTTPAEFQYQNTNRVTFLRSLAFFRCAAENMMVFFFLRAIKNVF